MRHHRKLSLFLFIVLTSHFSYSQEKQPFFFQTQNLIETLDFIGAPLSSTDEGTIQKVISSNGDISAIQDILDKCALFNVQINPESRVKVSPGKANPTLLQSGWKTFLVRVDNEAGITAKLEVESDQAKRTYDGGEKIYGMGGDHLGSHVSEKDIQDRWLDVSLHTLPPMKATLSGLDVEYFIIQLYSRDAGKRAAKFLFHCGQATQDIGFRSETDVLFTCVPSKTIRLDILDENKKPTTASLIVKDEHGHIYPSQMKRLAPDFFFQSQIYRSHGETIDLPAGKYSIEYTRGPEYLTKSTTLIVTDESTQTMKINLERWINANTYKWYSGDHHIHAAGCSHYTSPTEGVNPDDMFRHIVGEGVNVGSVLTWGRGYAHQRQYFDGTDNKLSTKENLLRYDMEISGFSSSHAGHLVLLRLKDMNYPNTTSLDDWPTYTLPVLKWAKAQGAVTGFAHTGLGLQVTTDELPNYEIPPFDGIGANEYIVAVTQNLVDFISTMDTPPTWELNIWYHTLNCGFRTRISGETDFPCMTDDKVARGRSYVKLEKALTFNDWAEGLRLGRTYTSEGKSHLIDFSINDVEMGTKNSEVKLAKPSTVKVKAKIAAFLNEAIDPDTKPLNTQDNVWSQKPFWNIERSRIGQTRTVPVELIVNGELVETKPIVADGRVTDIVFETKIEKSSWVALRIPSSSHSNPIFVLVNDKPIRANKKSAEWCLKAVDVCWGQKEGKISASEKAAAKADYEHAKRVYAKILGEM